MTNTTSERHILVIGGAGYIGAVLCPTLLAAGHRVRVLDNFLYENSGTIAHLMEHSHFSMHHGDFGQKPTLETALHGITDVVLLAALVGDPICKKYPELARYTNLEAPKQLIKMLHSRGIQRFIFTSTCSNYGLRNDDTLATEDADLNPQSLYAETKIEIESELMGKGVTLDFEPVVLRLSTAFGLSPRMRFDLTINEFTKDLAQGKALLVYDENTWRPYCHTQDISNAVLAMIDAPSALVAGEVFNIGSDHNNYTKKMILDIIQKQLPACAIEYKQGGQDTRNYKVSFEKVTRVLDYKTKYTAEDTVVAIIQAANNSMYGDIEQRKNFYGNYLIQIPEQVVT